MLLSHSVKKTKTDLQKQESLTNLKIRCFFWMNNVFCPHPYFFIVHFQPSPEQAPSTDVLFWNESEMYCRMWNTKTNFNLFLQKIIFLTISLIRHLVFPALSHFLLNKQVFANCECNIYLIKKYCYSKSHYTYNQTKKKLKCINVKVCNQQ